MLVATPILVTAIEARSLAALLAATARPCSLDEAEQVQTRIARLLATADKP